MALHALFVSVESPCRVNPARALNEHQEGKNQHQDCAGEETKYRADAIDDTLADITGPARGGTLERCKRAIELWLEVVLFDKLSESMPLIGDRIYH